VLEARLYGERRDLLFAYFGVSTAPCVFRPIVNARIGAS
jgi:hypothetical protein